MLKRSQANKMPENIKTASPLKKFLSTVLGAYLCAYIGLSAVAVYDFNKYNKKRIETEAKNSLAVKNYKVNLEGKLKELTIVGETHLYNHTESEYAKELLKDYEVIAYESGKASERSKAGEQYRKVLVCLFKPSFTFYGMGSGRYTKNPTIQAHAWLSHKKIYYLETGNDDIIDKLSFGQKSAFLAMAAYSLLTAPLTYWEGKIELGHETKWIDREKDTDAEIDYLAAYVANLHKRDKLMADNIAKLITKEDIDKLLCVMGKGHLKGVVKHLKSNLEMEEHRASNNRNQ